MSSYRIALIPGDGTGPEVVAEGVKVLNAISEKLGIKFEFNDLGLGGDKY